MTGQAQIHYNWICFSQILKFDSCLYSIGLINKFINNFSFADISYKTEISLMKHTQYLRQACWENTVVGPPVSLS